MSVNQKWNYGDAAHCFVIAEAGVNHNGDIGLAYKLIDAALASGADAVKFQTWITEDIVTSGSMAADYQQMNAGQSSQFQLLKGLELPHEAFRSLSEYAKSKGILFLSTPDDPASADFLVGIGMPVLKVGSGELTNLPFLSQLAGYGIPMILSTGMSTLDEVVAAVATIRHAGNPPLALLHCVSSYPADPSDCNLRAMDTLREALGLEVGFSDHTIGSEVAVAAVARGAVVIEKHLTLDRTMEGPDHSCSADPREFSEMVRAIRRVESCLGDGVKRPTAGELQTRQVVRKEAVAARALPAGHTLVAGDIAFKRGMGSGASPADVGGLYGRKLALAIAADGPINPDSLCDAP